MGKRRDCALSIRRKAAFFNVKDIQCAIDNTVGRKVFRNIVFLLGLYFWR